MHTVVQSVVFMRDKGWTVSKAKEWLTRNGYKTSFHGKGVDVKPNQLRFRQKPVIYDNYITKKLNGGILLVMGVK